MIDIKQIVPKIYCTKQIGDNVECYNRHYQHLLTLPFQDILPLLHESYKVIEIWKDWTGGLDQTPGYTLWWDTYER